MDATIVVEKGSTLVINSSDTKWLKILAGDKNGDGDRDSVNSIRVFGNLIIDSVKITSWDPENNDFIKFEVDILPSREFEHTGIDAIPRPYIKIEDETTGTTNITNSEIAYLGYECGSGCSGISYYGNNGTSIVKNNEIHHDRFGFYSVGVGGVVLEDNHVHHNFMYGFDPHTATHDMLIRNNTVHDHGAMGIICSLDCYNITIEGNEVYNSAGSGIMFSRNMSDSIARNNDVHDEEKCIFLSQSSNNEVYNNDISNCESQGIYIYHNSIENKVYNNTLTNATEGIEESDDSKVLTKYQITKLSRLDKNVVNTKMNHEYTNNNNTNPVYLKVAITEPVLLACINGSSFSEIYLSVQRVIPTSELVLREYIFYLLNSSFISYNGIEKIYFIEPAGLELLEIIYFQAERRIVEYSDLTLKIE